VNASGKISLPNLILLAAVASAIYFGVLLFPVMLDNFEVQDTINKAVNRSHQVDDRALRGLVASGLARVGTHYAPNPFGELVEVQGLGVKPEEVIVERNTVTQTIRVAVPYQRQIRLKPTQKFITLRFHPEREGSTTR
jgi:hypothetical protein